MVCDDGQSDICPSATAENYVDNLNAAFAFSFNAFNSLVVMAVDSMLPKICGYAGPTPFRPLSRLPWGSRHFRGRILIKPPLNG
jgi:hypothetical protein